MAKLKVALLQISADSADPDANFEKGASWCRRAAELGADVALFPETWSVGYPSYGEVVAGAEVAWRGPAIDEDSPYVRGFRALARELNMAIALTYLGRTAGAPSNAVSLIDRHGDVLFTYGKVHTCCYQIPEVACTPGAGFHVAELDTRDGPVKIGAMICYDREFPESARLLMLGGAEVILTPNACTLTEYDSIRIHQFRARAFENMVGVAMANYPAPQHDGHSIACNPDGTVLVEANEGQGLFLAEFDLDRIREWRAAKYWGDAFRRPGMYGPLTDPGVAAPFLRKDMLGMDLTSRRGSSSATGPSPTKA